MVDKSVCNILDFVRLLKRKMEIIFHAWMYSWARVILPTILRVIMVYFSARLCFVLLWYTLMMCGGFLFEGYLFYL